MTMMIWKMAMMRERKRVLLRWLLEPLPLLQVSVGPEDSVVDAVAVADAVLERVVERRLRAADLLARSVDGYAGAAPFGRGFGVCG